MIFKNICLNKFFLLFLLINILIGNFNYIIPYFLLLFIHEFGHAITGILMGYQLEKIIFYPLGGVTVFNLPINIPLKRELLIIAAGPIWQILGYFCLISFFPYIKAYHYTLLIFNLLPIYPLDGGRIFNIFCAYFWNYLVSFNMSFIVSIIVIIGLFLYNVNCFNLNLFLMIILMLFKTIKLYRHRYYYYQRMLLERYLYNYSFKKIKRIHHVKSFYRDTFHYINFMDEKSFLIKYFKLK